VRGTPPKSPVPQGTQEVWCNWHVNAGGLFNPFPVFAF
jgi:hypothetical protein